MKRRLLFIFGMIVGSSYPSFASQFEPPFVCQKEPFYYMPLTKAVDQTLALNDQEKRWRHEQPITVFVLTKDNKVVINPAGDAYPKTCRLNELTLKEAQALWGEPNKKEVGDTKTFDLIMLTGSPEQKKGYHLEAKFDSKGRLSAYKAKGPLIPNQDWTNVN